VVGVPRSQHPDGSLAHLREQRHQATSPALLTGEGVAPLQPPEGAFRGCAGAIGPMGTRACRRGH
jgi:hypothetical protein